MLSPVLALLGLAFVCVGCGSAGRRPPHQGELPPDLVPVAASVAAPTAAVVASAPPADAPPPQDDAKAAEREEDMSDYADEPEDGRGQVRDLGQKSVAGDPCLFRVGPIDPKLDSVVLDWIHTREKGAAREAAALCNSRLLLGSVAAGFACRTLRRRPNVQIVACFTFPNVMGNANPSRSHAVFDTTGGRPKLLGVGDMFVGKGAACEIVGAALAARGPQLHNRSPAQWSQRCRVSSASPVADDTISVVGPKLTFDVSNEFLAWGNAPDPVEIPIEDLLKVLTPRFAALLEI